MYVGKDATKIFYSLHRNEVLEKYSKKLKVGTVEGYDTALTPTPWAELSKVPYAEIDMKNSPFYNESHHRWRAECRRFFWEEGIVQWCESAEGSGKTPPPELYAKLGASGYLALCLGPGPHLAAVRIHTTKENLVNHLT